MNRTTVIGIPEREFAAVKAFFLRTTVPLIYESGATAGIQGTGCLFETADSLYFVTAGHVLEDVDPSKLGIPLRQLNSEVFTLGRGLVGWSKNEEFDVGAYRIDDEQFEAKLRGGYMVLSASNLGTPTKEGHFIVPGYPRATVVRDNGTLKPKDITQIHTAIYDGEVVGSRTDRDLFLKLERTAQGLWGHNVDVPDLRGISGAPVWQLVSERSEIWTPEAYLRLVGIQVACDPRGEKYIRALTWPVVQAALGKLGSSSGGNP